MISFSLGSIRRSAKKKRELAVSRGQSSIGSSMDQPYYDDQSNPFNNSRNLSRTPPPSDDSRKMNGNDPSYDFQGFFLKI
jgi:hypothetical protein